jgi:hypothetical protein
LGIQAEPGFQIGKKGKNPLRWQVQLDGVLKPQRGLPDEQHGNGGLGEDFLGQIDGFPAVPPGLQESGAHNEEG